MHTPNEISKPTTIGQQVLSYFLQHCTQLPPRQRFHFCSRLWLWMHHPAVAPFLVEYRRAYLGQDDDDFVRQLRASLATQSYQFSRSCKWGWLRHAYFERYPHLLRNNHLLFTTLFADTLYGRQVLPLITQLLSLEELTADFDRLLNDPTAVAVLSTPAVNYLYLIDATSTEKRLAPDFFYRLATTSYQTTDRDQLSLQFYLLTHCILGASRYYYHAVTTHQRVYHDMLAFLEYQLSRNFRQLSLDAKFEFLVCAALCGYPTLLYERIDEEAARSLSSHGDFVVDRHNAAARSAKTTMVSAEHRNVLLIMASQTPVFREMTRSSTREDEYVQQPG